MKFKNKIALFMILAAIQIPCAGHAAEEDKELSLIAAEQEKSGEDEQLDEINPALKESLSTERTQETDKEIKERKKKLKQTRKEKEKANEQKLNDSANQKTERRKEEPIVIDSQPKPQPTPPQPKPQPVQTPQPQSQPQPVQTPQPQPKPQPVQTPQPQPKPQPVQTPQPQPKPQPVQTPQPQPQQAPQTIIAPPTPIISQTIDTSTLSNQKLVYANFAEIARAVKFIPLYMPRKSGYEITALYAGNGIAEIRYGRRWEPTVSLTVRTHKRAEGEELKDISGVTGVKWRVDTTTGTTIYIAKISETRQVAAWAVGHYTFSAQAENLSYAGFHSLVADELVELSTHYYLDL